MSSSSTQTAANQFRFLADAVAWRYRPQGWAVCWQVRRRLLHDPFYRQLLAHSHLLSTGIVLDLGCGRGVLLALIASAQTLGMAGLGRRTQTAHLIGIEAAPVLADSARRALDGKADILSGELTRIALPCCSTAVLQDVLLYLPPPQQAQLLQRLVAELAPGGTILLCEPDAGTWLRQMGVRLAGLGLSLCGGPERRRAYPKSRADWTQQLAGLGLTVECLSANCGHVLLRADKPLAEAAPCRASDG